MDARFTGSLGNIDEDGYQWVEVVDPDGKVEFQGAMRYTEAAIWLSQELALRNRSIEEPGLCEHGLSAWLCEGPAHY